MASASDRDFETKSPFKDTKNIAPYRYGYETIRYTGGVEQYLIVVYIHPNRRDLLFRLLLGLRPRVKKGFYKDKKPIGLPPTDLVARDKWTKDKALKGQNDYIGNQPRYILNVQL